MTLATDDDNQYVNVDIDKDRCMDELHGQVDNQLEPDKSQIKPDDTVGNQLPLDTKDETKSRTGYTQPQPLKADNHSIFIKKQIGNYFPNTTDHHTDYVIYYQTHEQHHMHLYNNNFAEQEVDKVREMFFRVLVDDYKFKVHRISYKYHEFTDNYVLLSCSTDHLMREAERIKLELKLKTVCGDLFQHNTMSSFYSLVFIVGSRRDVTHAT
jgi:hypothetical protein